MAAIIDTMTERREDKSGSDPAKILNALPAAIIAVDRALNLVSVNDAAEQMFGGGAAYLSRRSLADLVADDSPLLDLVRQVFAKGHSIADYGLRLAGPKLDARLVDVQVAPVTDAVGQVVICLFERTTASKIDRQLTHRGAARSVAGLAAMLAHEIRNPLSGIRGAAQLLEESAVEADRDLTRLICDEVDRIGNLVGRMSVFSDERPLQRQSVNIHDVLGHVRRLAAAGFGRGIRFVEQYDPSLPLVAGNRDQLIQVFLNLTKNAAEAVPRGEGEIVLSTRFRHGWRLSVSGGADRLSLPVVVSVQDNGPGIPDDISQHLFEPFVTTKPNGTGLGLSLVAKIIQDHGGVVELDSRPRRTCFNVLLPIESVGDVRR